MCGICGFYGYRGERPIDDEVLAAMLERIRHRGPDDEGRFRDQRVALGMRRLSIIDVDGGRQPITNEDGSLTLIFNGEIYNYRALTEELRRRGHRFATASDTEVIVHLYEEYGERCVEHLRGMFGFALWDSRRRRLLLARDRLGIKPLYYTEAEGCLVFASEIKALLPYPGVVARMDLEALSNFLSLKYVPAPQTMFAGIYALPPGHMLICDPGAVTLRQYWDLSFARRPEGAVDEAACAEQLERLLRDAVASHLVSDVPFGAFLSGGVDSSTIVALMSQLLDRPVKTFSVGFAGSGAAVSELPYARMVAKHYETDHHEVIVGPDDFERLAETIVWHLDQPIADEAALANYMVARLASRHVKMVLTGEGGDELFAGYARYSGERFAPLFRRIPRPARALAIAASGRLPGLRRPKLALYALCQPDEVARLSSWFPLFNEDMKAALLSERSKSALGDHTSRSVFAQQLARTDARDPLSRMLYVDTKLWLPDDLLARGDKTSMAASIEARIPLLDHPLVEFVAGLPPGLKLRGLTHKYLLKRVSRAWLPEAIIKRKKQGFPTPIAMWLRHEARSYIRDMLAPAVVRRRGLFEPAYVARLLDEHDSGAANHGSILWSLLNIELWQKLLIDGQGAHAPVALPEGAMRS
jgi:asparagine synthase (glutamine-hydrolysing)